MQIFQCLWYTIYVSCIPLHVTHQHQGLGFTEAWYADRVCLSWLIEWCSIVNWWSEVLLICLEKNNSNMFGQSTKNLTLFAMNQVLSSSLFEIHSYSTVSAYVQSHRLPFSWWNLQPWKIHNLIQWSKWTCPITSSGVSVLSCKGIIGKLNLYIRSVGAFLQTTPINENPKELLGLSKYYESSKYDDKTLGTTSKTSLDFIWSDWKKEWTGCKQRDYSYAIN